MVDERINRRLFLIMGAAGLLSIPLVSCNTGVANQVNLSSTPPWATSTPDIAPPIMPQFRKSSGHSKSQPNIVVIFADDIGPGDIGFYHNQRTGKPPVVPTPNIDQMIADGIRFSDAHAPNSLCAPSRFSMLTGNYSYRNYRPFGVWRPWVDPGIEPQNTTSARIAKQGGYATAFIGKWGCGGQLREKGTGNFITEENPEKTDYTQLRKAASYFGFDHALELPAGIQGDPFAFYENSQWLPLKENSTLAWVGPEQHRSPNKESGIGDSNWDPTLVGPMLAAKAVAYIEQHKANKPDQPFFMFYSSQAVHVPHAPPAELDGTPIAGSTPGAHGDMIHELDTQVGMIMKSLKETGIHENTLLIFTSDNGGLPIKNQALAEAGHDSTNGLRGYKGRIYEGGDRVPFIAVWPNVIKPATESSEPIVGHDIVATIAALTGQKIPNDVMMDSLDLLPLFYGDSTAKGHEVILQQSPHGPHYAIRRNEWKLILLAPDTRKSSIKDSKPVALFDLKNNPVEDEAYNLVDDEQHQDVVRDLLAGYLALRETGRATVNNSE